MINSEKITRENRGLIIQGKTALLILDLQDKLIAAIPDSNSLLINI